MFQTQFNFQPDMFPGSYTEQESMTVPDMAMSLEEILKRYAASGTELPATVGIYSDDLDFDDSGIDLQSMDLAELDQLKKEVVAHIKDLQARAAEPTELDSSAPDSSDSSDDSSPKKL